MLGTRTDLLRKQFACFNLDKFRQVFPQVDENIEKLCKVQAHSYKNRTLAAVSLVHRSSLVYWPQDKSGVFSNEKLEFLGDAFLNFFIAAESMIEHPTLQEGALSRMRAALVGEENLALKSRNLGLGDCLLVGKAELNFHPQKRDSVLADVFEAVTAALLLDGGETKARHWLSQVFFTDFRLEQEALVGFDAKSRLQQWTQSFTGLPPYYRIIGTEGTPQQTFFIVAAFLGSIELARGVGVNKRDASKQAAERALQKRDNGQITQGAILELLKNE